MEKLANIYEVKLPHEDIDRIYYFIDVVLRDATDRKALLVNIMAEATFLALKKLKVDCPSSADVRPCSYSLFQNLPTF